MNTISSLQLETLSYDSVFCNLTSDEVHGNVNGSTFLQLNSIFQTK